MRSLRAKVVRQARRTRETDVAVKLELYGRGRAAVDTGIPFFDHMLELLARHALMNLRVRARGDVAVDYHHTVEDVGLVLGDALDAALGRRRGISRYGWCILPMDEAASFVAVDLGGRPYLLYDVRPRVRRVRDFDVGLLESFFRALATRARMNLHIALFYGRDPHHVCESVFKGVGRALRMACARDPRERGLPSTKGKI